MIQETGRVTILLVGEISQLFDADRTALRRSEIRLITTSLGPEVLNLAQREQLDLIVIDGTGPTEGKGLELCRNLKSLPMTEDIPVILISATSSKAEVEQAKAEAILCKPFAERELLETLRRFTPLPERRHPRYPVNLRFMFSSGDRVSQAFSRVISYGGAFLKTDKPIARGTRLDLRFRLPGEEQEIRCSGVVRSSLDWGPDPEVTPGFGVEFEDISPSDRERLASFVDSLQRGRLIPR